MALVIKDIDVKLPLSYIQHCSTDVLLHTLSFLSIQDHFMVRRVSKQIKRAASNPKSFNPGKIPTGYLVELFLNARGAQLRPKVQELMHIWTQIEFPWLRLTVPWLETIGSALKPYLEHVTITNCVFTDQYLPAVHHLCGPRLTKLHLKSLSYRGEDATTEEWDALKHHVAHACPCAQDVLFIRDT
jgi:hypothetical protein